MSFKSASMTVGAAITNIGWKKKSPAAFGNIVRAMKMAFHTVTAATAGIITFRTYRANIIVMNAFLVISTRVKALSFLQRNVVSDLL